MTDAAKFFHVDDGGADYCIVALSADHAKQILREHGIEFTNDDGDSAPIDDPAFAALEWKEISAECAAQIRCHPDDGASAARPLASYPIGEWFTSEF